MPVLAKDNWLLMIFAAYVEEISTESVEVLLISDTQTWRGTSDGFTWQVDGCLLQFLAID